MQRIVVVLGALLVLGGAIGWGQFGSANYRALEVLLVEPGDPPPAAVGQLGPVAVSLDGLVAGIVLLCAGLALRDATHRLSPLGRGLFVGASVFLAAGAIAWMWTNGGARASFRVMATSAVTPRPDDVHAALDALSTSTTVAGVLLAAGGVLALVAALAGFAASAGGSASAPSLPLLFAGLAGCGLLFICLLSFVAWRHGNALAAALAGGGLVKPAELAEHLAGVLMCGLLSGLGTCLTAGALGLASLVAAGSARTAAVD